MCEAEAGINLRTLKRIDSSIQHIEASATQVAVYKYNASSCEWTKVETEGSLFVVSRSVQPINAMFVMNRLNSKNMSEAITSDLDVNVQLPFLLYKNGSAEVYCIWFFDPTECSRVGETLKRLLKSPSRSAFTPNGDVGLKLAQLGLNLGKNINEPTNQAKSSAKTVKPTSLSSNNDVRNDTVKQTGKQRQLGTSGAKAKKNGSNQPSISGPIQILTRPSPTVAANGTSNSVPNKGRSLNVQELFAKAAVNNGVVKSEQKATSELMPSLHPANIILQAASAHPEDYVLTPDILHQQSLSNGHVNGTPATNMEHREGTQTRQTSTTSPTALSMEQLKQTLISLLQNDADFLHTIHTAYLSNFH